MWECDNHTHMCPYQNKDSNRVFVAFLLSTFSLLERFSATFWKVAVGIGPLEFYINLVHNSIVMMEQVCSALVAVKGNRNATIYKRHPR